MTRGRSRSRFSTRASTEDIYLKLYCLIVLRYAKRPLGKGRNYLFVVHENEPECTDPIHMYTIHRWYMCRIKFVCVTKIFAWGRQISFFYYNKKS